MRKELRAPVPEELVSNEEGDDPTGAWCEWLDLTEALRTVKNAELVVGREVVGYLDREQGSNDAVVCVQRNRAMKKLAEALAD